MTFLDYDGSSWPMLTSGSRKTLLGGTVQGVPVGRGVVWGEMLFLVIAFLFG